MLFLVDLPVNVHQSYPRPWPVQLASHYRLLASNSTHVGLQVPSMPVSHEACLFCHNVYEFAELSYAANSIPWSYFSRSSLVPPVFGDLNPKQESTHCSVCRILHRRPSQCSQPSPPHINPGHLKFNLMAPVSSSNHCGNRSSHICA